MAAISDARYGLTATRAMPSELKWVNGGSTPLGGPGGNLPVDAYLLWAHYSSYAANGGPPDRVGILLEKREVGRHEANHPLFNFVESLSRANPLNGDSRFVSAVVDRVALPNLAQAIRFGVLRRFELALPRGPITDSLPATPVVAPDLQPETGQGKAIWHAEHVLGVVDDGCCLAHEQFRNAGHSRFIYVWDQSSTGPANSFWKSAVDLPYGTELTRGDVNRALEEAPALGQIGERRLYERIGRPQWGTEGRTHGAGVLHTIGDRRDPGVATFPLVFVQLPTTTVADTSGGSLGRHVVDGARYIIRRAHQRSNEGGLSPNVTINLSLGSLAGPHDGNTIAELALAEMCVDQTTNIVIAAGNGATWNTHAVREVSPTRSGVFYLMVPPGNAREVYVEFWFGDGQASYTIEVAAPEGLRSKALKPGEALKLVRGDQLLGSLIFVRSAAQSPGCSISLLSLRPTRGGDAPPYGVWTITVRSHGEASAEVHAWVQRNDVILPPRRAQRGHFLDDGSGYVRKEMTLGSIANGTGTVVAGAYRLSDRSVVDYSGKGPTRSAQGRRDVDAYGPSDIAPFQPGISVPGFYSGTEVRTSGTSIAAPRVARWVASGRPNEQVIKSDRTCPDAPPRIECFRK